MIIDNFNRVHNYLRISLTNNCNFQCLYCNPEEKISEISNKKIMTKKEIFEISSFFVKMGVKKIRLTGGEPFLRKDFKEIISSLKKLNVEIGITTNGFFIDKYVDFLIENNIKIINLSLDTLDEKKFFSITKRNFLKKILKNIRILAKKNFYFKVNVVVMKGINENEIFDFIKWAENLPIKLRFIEYMPFKGNKWTWNDVFSYEDILNKISEKYNFKKIEDKKNDTSKNFFISKNKVKFAVISSISNSFCETCNRIRISSDGQLQNCLFSRQTFDLLGSYRSKKNIIPIILKAFNEKHKERGGLTEFINFEKKLQTETGRKMTNIGG